MKNGCTFQGSYGWSLLMQLNKINNYQSYPRYQQKNRKLGSTFKLAALRAFFLKKKKRFRYGLQEVFLISDLSSFTLWERARHPTATCHSDWPPLVYLMKCYKLPIKVLKRLLSSLFVICDPKIYWQQFSSERDQIWTQHVFLKGLDGFLCNFQNFEF